MWIVADVVFDSDPEAREAERLAREGKLAGVSLDIANGLSEIEVRAVDEDGNVTDMLETLVEGEIIGATQVAMPAFADARIVEEDGRLVAYLAPEGIETSDGRLVKPGGLGWRENAPLMFNDTSDGHSGAIHVGNLVNFRRATTAAGLDRLTKPEVSDGKLVGHGAGWGTCHTGYPDVCVTAPHSTYSQVTDGVKVYQHADGDNHAPTHLDAAKAMEWYESHCELVGIAEVGEDDHGIWLSGGASLDDGEYFLSGDWRWIDGQLELVSFLVVDNPGFPTALVASSEQRTLVGAGIVTETEGHAERVRSHSLDNNVWATGHWTISATDLELAQRVEILELESAFR